MALPPASNGVRRNCQHLESVRLRRLLSTQRPSSYAMSRSIMTNSPMTHAIANLFCFNHSSPSSRSLIFVSGLEASAVKSENHTLHGLHRYQSKLSHSRPRPYNTQGCVQCTIHNRSGETITLLGLFPSIQDSQQHTNKPGQNMFKTQLNRPTKDHTALTHYATAAALYMIN